jgi:hypothetical protein
LRASLILCAHHLNQTGVINKARCNKISCQTVT